jgi:ABC-type transport system involved in multi-copper enzyme maturation permease subunit
MSAPTTTSPAPTDRGRWRVSTRGIVKAEAIKLLSVRSNVITLVASGAVLVAFGMLFSALAGGGGGGPGDEGTTSSLTLAFAGLDFAQLVIGVLGALLVTSEYASGLIRTMFAAVPKRVPVVLGKAGVAAVAAWAVMTVAAFLSFFASQAVYGGDQPTYALTDPGVLRVVLATGVYGAGIAVIGSALGFIMRSTAASVSVLIAGLLIAPMASLLPDSVADIADKVLPSNAGSSFASLTPPTNGLSAAAGFAVFAAWAIGLLAIAASVVVRRDA